VVPARDRSDRIYQSNTLQRNSSAAHDQHPRSAREPASLKIIDISRYGNYRGDPLELPDDAGTADISGMKNRRDSGKVLDERRIEEPVCIGDDSDPQNVLRAHGAGTG